jgi:hypothetical protein
MTNIFARLKVNPFEDDVVTEPRRVNFSVAALNARPLEQLIIKFRALTKEELPRKPVMQQKAQLVVSPDRGYGKSHLLGRLFQALGDQATLIYLRPFQDPQRVWSSILLTTVQELERPNQNGEHAGSQLEAFSKGVLAHVVSDHMDNGGVSGYHPHLQDAVNYLRAHPLKVLGHSTGTRALIDSMKSRLKNNAELLKLCGLLRNRGIDLGGREAAWLRVLAAYAFSQADSPDRDAALKWLRGDPLEEAERELLKLAVADNDGRGDSTAEQINDLSFHRLNGLCALASYYRPFVFCFDQTEFYGSDKGLVDALGKCIADLYASFYNYLAIVTTNANNWTEEVLPFMQAAYQNRFSQQKIMLEGINLEQAKELISKRLQDFQISDAAILDFFGEGWLGLQFSGLPQLGVRDLLMRAAERFQSFATAEPRQKIPLADLFAIEVNKISANKALQQYSQDCLMWFAQVLARGCDGIEISKTDQRYFTVRWAWPDRSVYFAFEAGDHHARWTAIAKEAVMLAGASKRFAAILFRTPDLKTIPRPTWNAAKTVIADAQRRGLRVVPLPTEEVCELHAARELYSNALQGNINYAGADVLAWLKARFAPWFQRYSQPAAEPDPPATPPTGRGLTKVQVGTVKELVRVKKLVEITEVLKALGDDSLKEGVLRAAESSPNLKAHFGPRTIYLQWRHVA